MKPLKFKPLLKSTIWGGNKIIAFKHLDIKQEKVGESWEISGVPGNESIVADGEMKGKKLNEVVAELKENFLGADNYKRFGNEFPLLIKFIDANTDLSIQVHPNDEIAKKQLDSFVILIGLKGEAKITDNEGNEITLQGGESIVVPASTKTLGLRTTQQLIYNRPTGDVQLHIDCWTV